MRALLFYHDERAKRLKAIKSKSYRKHEAARLKMLAKKKGLTATARGTSAPPRPRPIATLARCSRRRGRLRGPPPPPHRAPAQDSEALEAEQRKADFERAQERLKLTHRNTSRWCEINCESCASVGGAPYLSRPSPLGRCRVVFPRAFPCTLAAPNPGGECRGTTVPEPPPSLPRRPPAAANPSAQGAPPDQAGARAPPGHEGGDRRAAAHRRGDPKEGGGGPAPRRRLGRGGRRELLLWRRRRGGGPPQRGRPRACSRLPPPRMHARAGPAPPGDAP